MNPASRGVVEKVDWSGFTMSTPLVSVYFRFSDHNDSLKLLNRNQLDIRLNGLPVPDFQLQTAFSDQKWLLLAIVVDASGSMQGAPLADARSAIQSFSAFLGVQDKVALYEFNDAVNRVMDFSRTREPLFTALDRINARGNTALFDAIAQALDDAGKNLAPRKALIVLSDGEDNRSQRSGTELIASAAASRIPVFTIGLGRVDEASLRRIAESTKGVYFHSPSSTDLGAIYGKISENLRNTYLISGLRLQNYRSGRADKLEIRELQKGGAITYYLHSPFKPGGGANSTAAAGTRRSAASPAADSSSDFRRVVSGKSLLITIGLGALFLCILVWVWISTPRRNRGLKALLTVALIAMFVAVRLIVFIVLERRYL